MPIIGDGDIASVLKDKEGIIYFASGVSNSAETRDAEFRREKDLLLDQYDKNQRLVYFSSLSIFYKDTPYTRHKKRMEMYVKGFPKYTIVRLGNITFGTNPHTLINYFKLQIAKGEELRIEDSYRYLIDKNEFLHWIEMIPNFNCEFNITGRMVKVEQIVEEIKDGIL